MSGYLHIMITIKETTEAALLAELNRETQEHHQRMYPEIFRPYVKEEIEKAIKKILSGREAKAFVIYDGDDAAGYAIIFISRFNQNAFQVARSAMQVDQFAVLEKFQNRGIGKQLMEFLIDLAKKENLTRIDLNHWTKNSDAGKFFVKTGFTYYNSRMYHDVKV
jgi:diamine N-acetyltransferase